MAVLLTSRPARYPNFLGAITNWQLRLSTFALALSLVVGYLNSQGEYAVIASRGIKGIAIIALIAASIAVHISGHPRDESSPPLVCVLAVVVLFGSLSASSLWNLAAFQDWILLLQAGIQAAVAFYLARMSPAAPLNALILAAAGHCLLAVLGGTTTTDDFFAGRASGGSHPILIGFASIVVLAFVDFRSRPRASYLLLPLGFAAMYLSFSRTSILGLLGAVILWVLLHPDFTLIPRLFAFFAALLAGASSFVQLVVNTLAQGNLDGLYSASGRSEIWSRLWSVRDVFLPFGIGLGDTASPNPKWHQIEIATLGQPAENSFLQTAVYGGLPAVIALAVLLLIVSLLLIQRVGLRWQAFALLAGLWSCAATTSGLSGFGFQFMTLVIVGFTVVRRPAVQAGSCQSA